MQRFMSQIGGCLLSCDQRRKVRRRRAKCEPCAGAPWRSSRSSRRGRCRSASLEPCGSRCALGAVCSEPPIVSSLSRKGRCYNVHGCEATATEPSPRASHRRTSGSMQAKSWPKKSAPTPRSAACNPRRTSAGTLKSGDNCKRFCTVRAIQSQCQVAMFATVSCQTCPAWSLGWPCRTSRFRHVRCGLEISLWAVRSAALQAKGCPGCRCSLVSEL